jgi:4-hydroxy-3-methylbut-2-enyl diphosphate reductase
MAIDCVERVLELKGSPIYVFHEIVHNRHVVEDFERRGVTFVGRIEEVPDGGVIVYSAHGISPDVRRQAKARNLIEVDATCPLVTKVHLEVLRFAKDGYHIIFIGHHNHDEAIGTMGQAPQSMTIIESEDDVARLQLPQTQKLAYVTQTTLSIQDANRVIAALQARYPNVKGPPKEDICYATTNRQMAVREIAHECDMVLVIGSKNSSNSRRLVETAHSLGVEAHLIDDEAEVDSAWLSGKQSIMVTAGASAPEHLVDALLKRLQRDFNGTIESRTLVQEDVSFALPKSLRTLAVLN